MTTHRVRHLSHFFGEEATGKFRSALRDLGILFADDGNHTDIDLGEFVGRDSRGERLAAAFEVLILEGDGVKLKTQTANDVQDLGQFSISAYREVHQALFRLSDSHGHVWIRQGTRDYGLRVAHEVPNRSVSLVTSRGVGSLRIVGRR